MLLDLSFLTTQGLKNPSVLFPYYANVYDLAVNSDDLVVCCVLTKQTHHIINKDVMGTGKGRSDY